MLYLDEDESQLILRRNSYIVFGAIQVTPDVNGDSMENLSGRALYTKPFRLWKGNHTTIASFNTSSSSISSTKPLVVAKALPF
ncbi:hypothetical protein J1N35_024054 [Gossypium stocksii]|uniref:Legume lectin domain-containing protein n=1 Tax=Gossypium stocksii TaxID=47602 RepID=A0A9D4A3R8_9ROSI|nr:hypothetical protein J1N35_024054 [Gossypium stocksii]